MGGSLDRARIWMEQGRVDLAEPELRRALVEDPEDPAAHAMLSLCLTHLDRGSEATDEAKLAISRAPDWPVAHYALAVALLRRGRTQQARRAIEEAVRLDPDDPDAWAVLGQIELTDRNWPQAVAAAERGLAIDAEHVDCANVRATGLAQQGDLSASAETVRHALEQDPENATTHAVAGWALLQQSELAEAGRHFTEALRIDPNNGNARNGLLQVLKARNVVYRTMLRFFVWMGRQSKRTIWIVIIGLWVVPRVLRAIGEQSPELQPLLYPIVGLMIGFVYLTWVIDPVFNAMLFLHPLGRHALNPRERSKAVAVVICLGLALAFGILALATGLLGLILFAIVLATFVIPLNVAFEAKKPHRGTAIGATILLGFVGLMAALIGFAGITFLDGGFTDLEILLFTVYVVGVFVLSLLSTRWALDPRTD